VLSPSPQLPLNLGRPVQHRSDPAKVLGTILGWVFDPAPRALVRWADVAATFEAADDIDDLAIVPAADESIAERIRRKVEQGLLPMTAPVTTAFAELTQWRRCDGCNHLMAPGRNALSLEYPAPTRVVRLHRGCREFWVLACRAIKEQRRAAGTGRAPRMPATPEQSERTGRDPSARRRAVRRRPVLPGSTLTVTRAALALLGLTVTALQPPVLTTGAMRALQPLLESEGFDLTHPVRVRELEDDQGFRLEQ
jgi:hypothetical protein